MFRLSWRQTVCGHIKGEKQREEAWVNFKEEENPVRSQAWTPSLSSFFLDAHFRDIRGRRSEKLQFLRGRQGVSMLGGQTRIEGQVAQKAGSSHPALNPAGQASAGPGLPSPNPVERPGLLRDRKRGQGRRVRAVVEGRHDSRGAWRALLFHTWIYKYNEASSVDCQPTIHQPRSTGGRDQVLLGL